MHLLDDEPGSVTEAFMGGEVAQQYDEGSVSQAQLVRGQAAVSEELRNSGE